MFSIRLSPTHSLFSVPQIPLIQVPRPRAEARGYPFMCPPGVHPLFRRGEYLGHLSALSCAQSVVDYILREYFLHVYLCSCGSGLLLLRHFNAPGVLLLSENCILRLSLIPTSEASNPESKISPNLLYFSGKHSWKTESGPGRAVRTSGAQHLATLVRFLGFSWNLVHTKDGEDFCTVKRDSFTK